MTDLSALATHHRAALTVRDVLHDPDHARHAIADLAHQLVTDIVALAPALVLGALTAAVAATLVRRLRDRSALRAGRIVEIGVPPDVDPHGALLLWSALHDLLRPPLQRLLGGQPHLSWEIAAGRDGTLFRIWIPASVPPGLVERTLTAAWPGATLATTDSRDEPVAETEDGHETGDEDRVRLATELVLSGPDCFALGGDDGPDPLGLVLAQLAGLRNGEQALVQVLAQPATSRRQQQLLTVARRMRAGIPTTRLARLLDPFHTGAARPPDPTLGPDVRAVLEKASRPLFRCLVRVTVTARDRGAARGRIHALAGAFAAYEGRVGLRRRRARHATTAVHERRLGRRGYLLSVPELAALAHLPSGPAVPGVARAGARRVAPSPRVRRWGKALGATDTGPPRPVAVSVSDARQHLHVLGATGAGKSTLIARLVLDDAHARRGAVVIDPKGDLVDAILERLTTPPRLLVVIDPDRQQRPIGLNVLHTADQGLAAEHVVGTFRRLYEQFWGPRTDDILRACVLTLARDPRLTLAEIPTCLTNPAWRAPLTHGLRREDPVLAGFWHWYDAQSDAAQIQAIGPLLNKLRAFLLRKPVRAIVGQQDTTFPLEHVLDRGGLLLARLPKGTLGEETSRLLGALLVARVWQQALGRSRRPEADRRDCALYVDEVHNYVALPHSFEDVLAEARGYRLSLCLAHQHLGQLPRPMADALSANARTKLIFTCSPQDARVLERHTTPELSAHDLANLARYQAACRTLASGEDTPAFTLQTTPLPDGDPARAEQLRRAAERRFGRDPGHIERRLRARQLRTVAGGHGADHRPDQSPDHPGDQSPDQS